MIYFPYLVEFLYNYNKTYDNYAYNNVLLWN